ncbi:hypothetical protein OAE79_01900 [Rhodopirellula sp.]|nr:hypothetical protein [Rhodopirellula sp.]MDB4679069.1 hypothetical protein [Rhodopirellula sp.]
MVAWDLGAGAFEAVRVEVVRVEVVRVEAVGVEAVWCWKGDD